MKNVMSISEAWRERNHGSLQIVVRPQRHHHCAYGKLKHAARFMVDLPLKLSK